MLEPFTGHVVAAAHAATVVTPPHDTLTDAERAARASDGGDFLGVLPPRGRATETALAACRRRLEALLDSDRFVPLPAPTLGVLELTVDGRRSVGVLGELPATAFGPGGRVRPHEEVEADRVTALARHLRVVRAASSPVCVAHRPDAPVRARLEERCASPPAVDLTDAHGRVRLWLVDDPATRRDLAAAVDETRDWLLADGHHRAAAAREAGRVLTVLMADDQLRVAPFHRRLRAAEPARAGAVLRSHGLDVTALPGPAAPDAPGVVTVAGGGRWWRVALPAGDGTALGDLDVRRVEQSVLAPLRSGLADHTEPGRAAPAGARDADRVVPVAPTGALAGLGDEAHVGVALAPPSLAEVRRVVDTGATLPPKTTYVTPKHRSGLVVVPR